MKCLCEKFYLRFWVVDRRPSSELRTCLVVTRHMHASRPENVQWDSLVTWSVPGHKLSVMSDLTVVETGTGHSSREGYDGCQGQLCRSVDHASIPFQDNLKMTWEYQTVSYVRYVSPGSTSKKMPFSPDWPLAFPLVTPAFLGTTTGNNQPAGYHIIDYTYVNACERPPPKKQKTGARHMTTQQTSHHLHCASSWSEFTSESEWHR